MRYRLFIGIMLFCSLGVSQAMASKRVALVIGNGGYQHAGRLANPANDARDMANTLRTLGFDVVERVDAGKRGMISAVKIFGKKLQGSEVGLFFYAGHGMQIRGVNYLIPIDADPGSESDVEFDSIDAGRILGKMREADNNLNIIVLDACRNNPFKRSFRSARKGLARMDAPVGSLLAYATSPGSVAADGDARNGLFTGYLLKNLVRPGLSVREVFDQTGLAVMKDSGRQQIPWTSSTPMTKYYLAGSRNQPANVGTSPTSAPTGRLFVNITSGNGVVRLLETRDSYVRGMHLSPGTYTVEVVGKGRKVVQRKVVVTADMDSTLDVALPKPQSSSVSTAPPASLQPP